MGGDDGVDNGDDAYSNDGGGGLMVRVLIIIEVITVLVAVSVVL